jgi:hypothetical protein
MSESFPVLNWQPNFDDRSKNFPVRGAVPQDVRTDKMWSTGPILDQGREGACVGFGWTAEALSEPHAANLALVGSAAPHDPTQFALAVYHRAQQIDDTPGEDYVGTSVLAGAKTMVEFGILEEYRWAFTIDDVIDSIIHKGPVVLGIKWYNDMYEAPAGVLKPGGPLAGGHCITAVGYCTAASSHTGQETIVLQNSWGSSWGMGGTAQINVTDLAELLADQGEACVPFKHVEAPQN